MAPHSNGPPTHAHRRAHTCAQALLLARARCSGSLAHARCLRQGCSRSTLPSDRGVSPPPVATAQSSRASLHLLAGSASLPPPWPTPRVSVAK
eukprot:364062-Chlamydomonas_euryale.AAC.13